MRLILWLLALFAAAVAVTLAAKYNTGHVLLIMQPYRIELSLNIFLIGLLAAFCVFYVIVRLLAGILGFNRRHRHKKSEYMLLTGIKAYFEGNYARAKKATSIALKLTEQPTEKAINAVIAARSAHELKEYSQRDEYLATAKKEAPDERVLRLVTQTELQLSDRKHEEALDSLQELYSTGGLQQTAVILLELEAQQQAGNWDVVIELTTVLEGRRHFNKAHVKHLRHNAHFENIKAKSNDLQSLNKYWQDLPIEEKRSSDIAVCATRAYIALGDFEAANLVIEQSVDAEWNPELITLYSQCLNHHVNRQIECAEVWLRAQPNNAYLLLTLGKLCTHCELWGKAQNYLEASLSVEPGHAAHLALAQLNEKLGKHELAIDHYNKGLNFTLKQLN